MNIIAQVSNTVILDKCTFIDSLIKPANKHLSNKAGPQLEEDFTKLLNINYVLLMSGYHAAEICSLWKDEPENTYSIESVGLFGIPVKIISNAKGSAILEL